MGQFSALILFLLAIGLLLRIDLVFYIVYVCLGLLLWSRWYTPRALAGIAVSREYIDHAFWGETVVVRLKLVNRNWLPVPWIQFAESVAVQLAVGSQVNRVVSLRTKESLEFSYLVTASRRGTYRLGPLRFRMGDLFGLSYEQRGELPADTLTVYPRIIPLTHLDLTARLPFGTVVSRQRLFADPSRPSGVREYRSGDSLRQINWKASAHTRHLMVKRVEPAISLESSILLNLNLGDYQRRNRATTIEWAIELAASLAVHLVDRRQAVGLLNNGIDPLADAGGEGPRFDETTGRMMTEEHDGGAAAPSHASPIPPKRGRQHLMKLLEQLARIEGGDTVPFTEWAPKACHALAWGVTILSITAKGDERSCQSLHRLVRSGYNPVLIVVEPDYNFGIVRERARRLGFAAHNLASRDDLLRWARTRQGTVQ
jgi:uncharacterized protein (DUF58 family)